MMKQKTKVTVSFMDAMKAYSEGSTIIGTTGVEYWIYENNPRSYREDYNEIKSGTPNEAGRPYTIKTGQPSIHVAKIISEYKRLFLNLLNQLETELEG